MAHGLQLKLAMSTRLTSIHPHKALSHPLWLMALAVSTAGTYVALRGWLVSPWLAPSAQCAQLVVAPSVLGLALGMRTRSAMLACHIVVAQVYAGVQLSPALAGLAAVPLDYLGVSSLSWAQGAGPQRLLCLVGPALSYLWLTPRMATRPITRRLPDPTPRYLPT